MKTGDLIKQARLKAGLTQAELANRLGTTTQNISQYERNVRKPKIETLQKIASALEVDWYSLFVAESDAEQQEANAIKLYNAIGLTAEAAKADIEDHHRMEAILQAIRADMAKLNEAGVIAAGQLVLSAVAKQSAAKTEDPNSWLYNLMYSSFSTVEEYNEVKNGIDALLKISAYRRSK